MQHVHALIHRLPQAAAAAARFTLGILACRAMVHLPPGEVRRLRKQLASRGTA